MTGLSPILYVENSRSSATSTEGDTKPWPCTSFRSVEAKTLVLLRWNLGMKPLVPINPPVEFKVFLAFRPWFPSVSDQTEPPSVKPCWRGSGTSELSKISFSSHSIFLQFYFLRGWVVWRWCVGKSLPLIISQDENSKHQVWLLWNYWDKHKVLVYHHHHRLEVNCCWREYNTTCPFQTHCV